MKQSLTTTMQAKTVVNLVLLCAVAIFILPLDARALPVITSTPVTDAIVDQPYTYDVNATGIPALTYSLTVSPAGMTINTATGVIDWTPTEAQLGLNPVTVEANDIEGTDTQIFDVNVAGVAPVIISTAVTTATVNQAYSYNVDANGIPAPTYSLTVSPAGMTINAATGVIDWTPTEAQLGLNPVTVEAFNSEANDVQGFDIDVAGVRPAIISPPVITATVNQPYTYDVNAIGIPAPTYSLAASPFSMTINAITGVINWTPAEMQLGSNVVSVEATNSEDTYTQIFYINVTNGNVLPVDDFNDSRRGAMWAPSEDDPQNTWVIEDVNQLNLRALIVEPNLVPDCVGHWKMNDNAGNTTVVDSTGNGNDGTFNDVTGDPNTNAHSLGGKINDALSFDGTDDFVNLGSVIGTGAYTKAAWVKRADGNVFNNILSSSSLPLTAAHALYAPNYWSFKLSAGHDDPYNAVQDSIGLEADRWYYVAVTYDPAVDSGKMVLYKDGIEVDSATAVPARSLSVSTYIGGFDDSGSFKGSIDNVMIFNKALTADEIAALYNGGTGRETIPAGTDSLQAFYAANGWSFNVVDDFKVKVDFHYSGDNSQNGWVGINVANDNGYASISAGSNSSESYFYYEALVDSNIVFEQEARDTNDGTLYISYDANSNNLYLSHIGYGDANAYTWQTTPDPLQGQWASEPVDVAVGGGSQNIALGPGEAYLDNFEVTDVTLLGWPPITDLDEDGFIGWGDVEIMGANWLQVAQLLSSYVGHWKMNDNADNTTVLDSSGNGNDRTFNDATGDPNTNAHSVAGRINDALSFDGTDDFVNLGTVVGTGAYTKVAWVKRADGDFFNNILSSSSTSATAAHALFAPYYWSFKLSAGHVSPYNAVQDSIGLEVDKWYHVAVTYDPAVDSGKMVLYKDGMVVDSATAVPAKSVLTSTYIGKFGSGGYFKGSIDNVMIFDKALTPHEVWALYNDGMGRETIGGGELNGDINDDGVVNFPDFTDFAWLW